MLFRDAATGGISSSPEPANIYKVTSTSLQKALKWVLLSANLLGQRILLVLEHKKKKKKKWGIQITALLRYMMKSKYVQTTMHFKLGSITNPVLKLWNIITISFKYAFNSVLHSNATSCQLHLIMFNPVQHYHLTGHLSELYLAIRLSRKRQLRKSTGGWNPVTPVHLSV